MPGTDTSLILDALGTFGAIVIALAALRIGAMQFTLLAPKDAEAMPAFHVLGLTAGVLFGFALLLGAPHLDQFTLRRIFAPDSLWAAGAWEFLAGHALPTADALAAFGAAFLGAGSTPLLSAAWLGMAVFAAGLLVALRGWRGRRRLRAIGAFIVLVVWTALILGYAAHLIAWSAAHLSFWIFALALLLFQRWRHAAPAGH